MQIIASLLNVDFVNPGRPVLRGVNPVGLGVAPPRFYAGVVDGS